VRTEISHPHRKLSNCLGTTLSGFSQGCVVHLSSGRSQGQVQGKICKKNLCRWKEIELYMEETRGFLAPGSSHQVDVELGFSKHPLTSGLSAAAEEEGAEETGERMQRRGTAPLWTWLSKWSTGHHVTTPSVPPFPFWPHASMSPLASLCSSSYSSSTSFFFPCSSSSSFPPPIPIIIITTTISSA
jgi:hypothetical protein